MSSNYINEYTGKAIRTLRQSKNLTLNELARKIHVSYQQLQKYEKGTNRLSIDKLYEISKYLGIEIYNFFPNANFSFEKENIQKVELSNAFNAITDDESRQIVLKLMGKLADQKPSV